MDPIIKLLNEDMMYESFIRSLTDNFQVVDLVENMDNLRLEKNKD